jgi:hypothetical protein
MEGKRQRDETEGRYRWEIHIREAGKETEGNRHRERESVERT